MPKKPDVNRITIVLTDAQHAELLTAVADEQTRTEHKVTAATFVKTLVVQHLDDNRTE